MPRRPYVPSGNSDAGALPILVGVCLAAGVAAGAVEGFVSQWLSLLLVYPAILGAIVGVAGISVIKSRRMRQPLLAGLVGLATGFAAEATVHAVRYEHARSLLAESLRADPRAASFIEENGISKAVDAALSPEGGPPPLISYLQIAAQAGVTISHAGSSSSSSPTLTNEGVYFLWLVNFLIVCGIAGAMLRSEAIKPFCEGCNAWYDATSVVATGAANRAAVKETVKRLEDGMFAEAVSNLGQNDTKAVSVLRLRSCSNCSTHEPVLELIRITFQKGKAVEKKVFDTLVTAGEGATLRSMKRPAPAST